jgi:hypothetical protein
LSRGEQTLYERLGGYDGIAGGPVYYTGRDMKLSHAGMGITESDWSVFLGHAVLALRANRPLRLAGATAGFNIDIKHARRLRFLTTYAARKTCGRSRLRYGSGLG